MACFDGADSVKIPQLGASEEAKTSSDGVKYHHQPVEFTQTALETEEVWTPPEQKGRETSNCKYFFYFFFFKVDISSIQSVGVTVLCSCSGLLGGLWRCVTAGLCFFLFFLLLVIVAQKKQREHPQNAADGHSDGFTLQEEEKKSYRHGRNKNPSLVILLTNSCFYSFGLKNTLM